ncbi:MAG: PQQ-binding-like beta-propeller repeat protein, partial [Candidatus Binatia bacterium]
MGQKNTTITIVAIAAAATALFSGASLAQIELRAADIARWSVDVPPYPGVVYAPRDGSLVVTRSPAGSFVRIEPSSGAVLTEAIVPASIGTRSSAYVPTLAATDLVVGGYENRHGVRPDGTVAWSWILLGCCNVFHMPFAVDPSSGRGHLALNGGMITADLSSGTKANDLPGTVADTFAYLSIASSDEIYAAGIGGLVTRLHPSSGRVWQASIGASPLRPASIAADGSIVVTSGRGHLFLNESVPQSPDPGRLARLLPGGTVAWNHDAGAVTPPIIGGEDLVFVGTLDAIEAYDLASGASVWSHDTGSLVNDLLVGDGGLLYALVGPLSNGTLIVLDQRTGAEILRVLDVSAAWEMILQEGTLYA